MGRRLNGKTAKCLQVAEVHKNALQLARCHCYQGTKVVNLNRSFIHRRGQLNRWQQAGAWKGTSRQALRIRYRLQAQEYRNSVDISL